MPGRGKEESDSATKKENCIIDLFNENDTEEPSQERSNFDSAERSSEYQYCSDVLSCGEEAGAWFDAVCDRDTCRIGTTMPSHAPTPSSASSSSSSSSFSPIVHPKSSRSSFDAVFNPMPMPLYNSPDEILDWADWLATVCVSSEDRKHIDLCEGGLIPIPEKNNAINIRDGVMRGIQIWERERERNIRESILREKNKKIDRKKFSEVVTVDEDEEEEDDDDGDNDDDAEDIEGGDDDEDDEDESEENDEEEEEEEEEEDEDYAGSRTRDALPSRSSSRKRKAVFD
jgi:hypothetical protein